MTVWRRRSRICSADGKSALEKALDNDDYRPRRNKRKKLRRKKRKGRQLSPSKDENFTPSIRYVLPRSKMSLVLVLDISQKMNPRRWSKVRDAVFRVTSNLPSGSSSFALVTFDSVSSRVNVPPTVVRADNREGLLGRVPHRLSAGRNAGCVACGLEAAFDLDPSGSIVLITASAMENNIRMNNILNRVEEDSIPIHHISFEDSEEERRILARIVPIRFSILRAR